MSFDRQNQPTYRTFYGLPRTNASDVPPDTEGLWNDKGTLKWRNDDGTDAVVTLASGAPFFVAVTKTAAALAGSPVYANGDDGVGATLTRGSNGTFGTVGGVTLTSAHLGKLILVDQQADPAQNGLYALTTVGSGSVKAVITRVAGFDTADTIVDGAQVAIQQGTYEGQIYTQTATVATVGTDAITFALSASAVTYTAVKTALAAADSAADLNGQNLTGLGSLTLTKEAARAISVAASTTTNTAGAALTVAAAAGSPGDGTNPGGTGGAYSDAAGAGGAASATQAAGAGGARTVAGGAAGSNTAGGGGANGGALNLRGGAKSGSGTDGTINIGDQNTSAINIGAQTNFNARIAAGASSWAIADPGNAGAIPVTTSGVCNLTTAGAETRTIANPSFVGQVLTVCLDTDGGDAVLTVASGFNQAGNTTVTMDDAGDAVQLVGVLIGGTRRWRLAFSDGVTLG